MCEVVIRELGSKWSNRFLMLAFIRVVWFGLGKI